MAQQMRRNRGNPAVQDEGTVNLVEGKKKKTPKAPKPPKVKKTSDPKQTKKNSKGSGGLGVIGVFLFFVLVIGGFVALVYLNIFDLKLRVDEIMGFSTTALEAENSVMADREQALADKEQNLADRENMLKIDKRELDAREKELDNRENEIAKKEEETNTALAEAQSIRDMLEGQIDSINNAAALISKMEAADAVAMFSEISDTNYIVRIMRALKPDQQAEILAAMEPARAAVIFSGITGAGS